MLANPQQSNQVLQVLLVLLFWHSLVFQFQQFCFNNNIDCLFFSYFDKLITDTYGYVLRKDLIYPTTITHALTGQEYDLPDIREHKYFAGKLFHPNLAGHQQIAKILYDQYIQTYG